MRNIVNTYVDRFRHEKKVKIRLACILAALAAVVTVVVFWQLHYTGIAMTNEVYCGMEEHIHTDDCYEQVLVCGLEESDDVCDEDGNLTQEGHVHTEDCYETQLTCGLEEHTHTIECMIDETADVETRADWEATIPDKPDGTAAENLIAVARSQVGYTESTANFRLNEDGETRDGYTRYGAWYGNEYGEWNSMFAAFCLNYAGISENDFPVNSGADGWIVDLKQAGLYENASDYTPIVGDLMFLDTDRDGKADAVDIIEETETTLDEEMGENVISKLYTVEGDFEDTVAELAYTMDGGQAVSAVKVKSGNGQWKAVSSDTLNAAKVTVMGYGVLPVQTDEDIPDEGSDENVLTCEGGDYTVTVTYGPEAELPEDVELVVSEYDKNSEIYQNRYDEAAGLYGWDEDEDLSDGIRLFNIGLYVMDENGDMIEVEPADTVQVSITCASDGEDESDYQVTHFGDETETLDADTVIKDGGRSVNFEVSGFSDIMVTRVTGGGNVSADSNYPDLYNSGYNETLSTSGYTWHDLNSIGDLLDIAEPMKLSIDNCSIVQGTKAENITGHDHDEYFIIHLTQQQLNDIVGADGSVSITNASGVTLPVLKFTNAGYVNGREVDVTITFESVDFKYVATLDPDTDWTDSTPLTYVAPENGLDFVVASFYSTSSANEGNNLWVGQFNDAAEADGDVAAQLPVHEDFTTEINLRISVTNNDDSSASNSQFLQVASDIDMWYNADGSSGMQSAEASGPNGNWIRVAYAEAFTAVSGFSNDYYWFEAQNQNYISVPSNGQLKAEATKYTMRADNGSLNGKTSYTEGGVYAQTNGSDWTISWLEGHSASEVEIYIPSYDINVLKVDSTETDDEENYTKMLEGAEFYLTRIDGGTTYYYTGNALDSNRGVYYSTWSASSSEANLITDVNGFATALNLDPGDYYLEESSPPDGYAKTDDKIHFSVSFEGIVSLLDDNGNISESTSSGVYTLTYNSGQNIYTFTVGNAPGAELPKTGSIGTRPYTIGGAVLIMAAAACLVYTYKRRKGGAIH